MMWKIVTSTSLTLLLAASILGIIQTPIWSPRDEIAHFDFVEQLSNLKYPRPDSPISERTVKMCRDEFEWLKPDSYDGTRESMGLAGWSYESQNPPAYYLLLAPALKVLEMAGTSPRTEVLALRIVTFLMYFIGGVLLIPVFWELERIWSIRSVYGAWLAGTILLANHHYASTLGNDTLSLLLTSLMLLTGLRWLRKGTSWSFAVMLLATGALSVTKLTNLPLVAFPPVLALIAKRRGFPPVRPRSVWLFWLPVLPVVLFLIVNALEFGSPLGSSAARNVFASFVHPLGPVEKFLWVLSADSYNLVTFGLHPSKITAFLMMTFLMCGAVQSLVYIARMKNRIESILHLACCGVVVAVLAGAAVLNSIIPGVHWQAFRHYYGWLPFWTFAIIAFPLRIALRVNIGWPKE